MLDEEAYRAAMRAHHAMGDPPAALKRYERLRTVLAEELGTDPAPETQDLHLAVLKGEDAAVEDPDSGEAGKTGAAEDPREPGFVGRDAEMHRLKELWSAAAAGAPTMVLVCGEAGIGKTRLSWEVARLVESTGGRTIQARCYEAERSLFLQPISEAIRSVVVREDPRFIQEVTGEWAGTISELVP